MFWNTRGEIIGANDAFLRIVGYTRADHETGLLNWAAMTPPEYAQLDLHCSTGFPSRSGCHQRVARRMGCGRRLDLQEPRPENLGCGSGRRRANPVPGTHHKL